MIVSERTCSNRDAEGAAAGGNSTLKRGKVLRGFYLPTLTSSFHDCPLESAYQRYSHRQRQKSLIIVNCVDIILKLICIVLISIQVLINLMI